MRYGACCEPGLVDLVARAGFDYFEGRAPAVTVPDKDDRAFADVLAQLRAAPIPCEALNCLLPGHLRVTGPAADLAALDRYVATVLKRAAQAQVKVIVFGSGGSRNVPDGFDRSRALNQLLDFGRMLADHAGTHGVTVALEPLCKRECNLINSLAEAAAVARNIGSPAFRTLADSYHWGQEDLPSSDIVDHAGLLGHTHVATVPNRLAPGVEECEKLREFFAALRAIHYDGRISVECTTRNPQADLPVALAAVKRLTSRT